MESMTHLISRWNTGQSAALDELITLAYGRLHSSAKSALGYTSENPTLQATELVNELYCHFKSQSGYICTNSGEFFAIAAFKLRQILQERFRRNSAAKRGGAEAKDSRTIEHPVATTSLLEFIVVKQVLDQMRAIDEQAARLVELRIYWEFSVAEVASILGISERTTHRLWQWAKAWLVHRQKQEQAA